LVAVPLRPLARALTAAVAVTALVAPAARAASHLEGRLVAASAPAAAAPDATAAATHCVNTHVTPTAGNLAVVRSAILCLHNQVRARHGLPRLKENRRLRKAAAGHSASMVRGRYFDHTDPNGVTFVQRVMSAGYVHPNQGWTLGENIAWGSGSLATPAAIMKAWMKSPDHRANILRRSYREVGIGIVVGVPTSGGTGATFTADFGARS
jgi:uncharacterized protein YkwD